MAEVVGGHDQNRWGEDKRDLEDDYSGIVFLCHLLDPYKSRSAIPVGRTRIPNLTNRQGEKNQVIGKM